MNKQLIRQQLITKRHQLSHHDQQQASQAVAQHFLKRYQSAFQHIAFYVSHDNEIDPLFIVENTHAAFYLPCIHNHHMHFLTTDLNFELTHHYQKIRQPHFNPDQVFAAEHLDCVLVPLVGCNRQGYRLGRGAGHYDRAFQFKLGQQCKPWLIGLAYDWQVIEDFSADAWDVPLDIIITNQTLYEVCAVKNINRPAS